MQDFYLSHKNVVKRLLTEWNKYGKLIIAYDFDNTVFDYHREGHAYHQVIDLLRRAKKLGAELIVFTASDESRYEEIRTYLKDNDIPFNKINENVDYLPFTGRKIYYNILLDDRAGLESSFLALLEVVEAKEYALKTKSIKD